ncbi:MAG: metal ABC transporter substrate-binding protein [Acidobacteriota bacterium]|nr:metal ABC transporter substrate-binding protein [Acidobacteriota bacterium]
MKRAPMRVTGGTIALLMGLLAVFVFAACSGGGAAAPKLNVVTTNNIVADWVRNIGGDDVEVFSLLSVGADPHTYQPGARDVTQIADADLVLSIGLGLEGAWLQELLHNAAKDPSTVIELGEGIDPIEFAATHAEEVELLEDLSHIVHEVEEGEITAVEGLMEIGELMASMEMEEEGDHAGEEEEVPDMVIELLEQAQAGTITPEEVIEEIEHLTEEGEEEHDDHGHGLEDPHFWFDPIRVQSAVNDIAGRLGALDPDRADSYLQNADSYNRELADLDSWTMNRVSEVPEDRRLLVTSHDSFGYFAVRYGFIVVGVVLSTTTDVEPSASDLAELAHEVEELQVPAVFGETTVTERLAQAVAEESGADLVRLYSGSLGAEGGDADTYITMVRANVDRIVAALQ